MGLDASVKCRCWEDGLCKPPASLAPRLWFDPTTAEVNITMPDGLPEEELMALYLEYDLWILEGACAHDSMSVVGERISNWGGLREFQHALRSLGEGSNAALLREIPNGNSGLTKSADARMCLAELNRFCSASAFGRVIELVDGNDGGVIHSRIGPYDGWLGTDGATGISSRLNLDGTLQVEHGPAGVMRPDPDAEILFCSNAFSQARTAAGMFCFTDLTSGKQLTCTNGIQDASGRYPASLKVTQGLDISARYAHCIEPLRRVFQAAIDTGHPVLWA